MYHKALFLLNQDPMLSVALVFDISFFLRGLVGVRGVILKGPRDLEFSVGYKWKSKYPKWSYPN